MSSEVVVIEEVDFGGPIVIRSEERVVHLVPVVEDTPLAVFPDVHAPASSLHELVVPFKRVVFKGFE